MAILNFCLKRTLFCVGLSINFVLGVGAPSQGQVTSEVAHNTRTLSGISDIQVTFDPPQDGRPDDTAGGASRDSGRCSQDPVANRPSITPLMPMVNHGFTVAEHPTLFVYIPPTSAKTIFFSLKDEKEDYYYQTTISRPKQAGIVSFKLPADAPPLEVGKRYQWSFVTICGERLAVDDPRVEGHIERVALNSDQLTQLKNLSLLERAALYGADGIWYDTLSSLAELRRLQPNNTTLATTWENLLKSVGLEAVATQSLTQ